MAPLDIKHEPVANPLLNPHTNHRQSHDFGLKVR